MKAYAPKKAISATVASQEKLVMMYLEGHKGIPSAFERMNQKLEQDTRSWRDKSLILDLSRPPKSEPDVNHR